LTWTCHTRRAELNNMHDMELWELGHVYALQEHVPQQATTTCRTAEEIKHFAVSYGGGKALNWCGPVYGQYDFPTSTRRRANSRLSLSHPFVARSLPIPSNMTCLRQPLKKKKVFALAGTCPEAGECHRLTEWDLLRLKVSSIKYSCQETAAQFTSTPHRLGRCLSPGGVFSFFHKAVKRSAHTSEFLAFFARLPSSRNYVVVSPSSSGISPFLRISTWPTAVLRPMTVVSILARSPPSALACFVADQKIPWPHSAAQYSRQG